MLDEGGNVGVSIKGKREKVECKRINRIKDDIT